MRRASLYKPLSAYDVQASFDVSDSDALLASMAKTISDLSFELYRTTLRLRALEATSELISPLLPSLGVVDHDDLPRSVEIDAGAPIQDGQGLHGLEYDEAGRPYRWSGPTNGFSFPITVSRHEELAITLLCRRSIAEVPDFSIRCIVDGEPRPSLLTRGAENLVVSSSAPVRSRAGRTVIGFVCSHVHPAPDNPDDHRILGVYVQALKVEAMR